MPFREEWVGVVGSEEKEDLDACGLLGISMTTRCRITVGILSTYCCPARIGSSVLGREEEGDLFVRCRIVYSCVAEEARL
jgi:hypothetical protein